MANTSTLPVEDNVVAAGSAAPGHNFPALDGLRAIAIAAVLVAHFRGGIDIDSPANKSFVFWTDFGWMGVDLFFVLSGFLITGILLDSKKNAQILPWRRFFRPFYGRRILRIFPLYWVYLLIVWKLIRPLAKASVAHSSLFSAAMYYAQEIPKDRFAWHFLYLSNWLPINSPHFPGLTHLWSLAVEEQFYILWPILIYITPRRYLSRLCICGILLAPLVRCLMLRFGAPPFMVYRLTLCRVDALCAGALLAVALREKEGTAFCRAYMNWIGLCSAIGLADVLWGSGSLMWDNSRCSRSD